MRLFLIRHGETVDNVAGMLVFLVFLGLSTELNFDKADLTGVFAGHTDSALSQRGVLQAERLGKYLVESGVKVSHIFSSDLQRAFITAESVFSAQRNANPTDLNIAQDTLKLEGLREQFEGSLEGKKFSQVGKLDTKAPDYVDVESNESMTQRTDAFVDKYLVPLLGTIPDDYSIVVVAHGTILRHLWPSILRVFPDDSVEVAPDANLGDYARQYGLQHISGWPNTGYELLDLSITHFWSKY
jgi:broad specificity phosphatase PhoE